MSKTIATQREYETVFVINPDIPDEALEELLGKFNAVLEKTSATLLREDRWGKRRMAYEINPNPRGNYVLLHYVGEHQTVAELERTAKNTDVILRFITDMRGPVSDIEAKKTEVEKMVRERSERAKQQEMDRDAEVVGRFDEDQVG